MAYVALRHVDGPEMTPSSSRDRVFVPHFASIFELRYIRAGPLVSVAPATQMLGWCFSTSGPLLKSRTHTWIGDCAMLILLDTNVWRYISDEDAAGALQSAVSKTRHRIAIAPAVLYEALRVTDVVLRRRLVEVMTRPAWYRLMPDAYSESEELRAEIQRLRPEWLRDRPDLEHFKRVRSDWKKLKGGFWERARNEPGSERDHLLLLEKGNLDVARDEARLNRETSHANNDLMRGVPLTAVMGRLKAPEKNWVGDDIEVWRLAAWSAMATSFKDGCSAHADWLAGEVELQSIFFDPKGWDEFWFLEVEASRLPRMWLRWAIEFLQSFHKVTDGTPVDAQIASYLTEVDLVISADKRFVEMCRRCQREAPFSLAEAKSVGAGKEGVRELFDLVRQV